MESSQHRPAAYESTDCYTDKINLRDDPKYSDKIVTLCDILEEVDEVRIIAVDALHRERMKNIRGSVYITWGTIIGIAVQSQDEIVEDILRLVEAGKRQSPK